MGRIELDVSGALPARAMNALVARHVFGLTVVRKTIKDRKTGEEQAAFDEILPPENTVSRRPTAIPVLHYVTDIRMAWDVVAEMNDRGLAFAMGEKLDELQREKLLTQMNSQEASWLICRAALEVLCVKLPAEIVG